MSEFERCRIGVLRPTWLLKQSVQLPELSRSQHSTCRAVVELHKSTSGLCSGVFDIDLINLHSGNSVLILYRENATSAELPGG